MPEHYRWKYGDGGKAEPSFEYCAREGQRILGYYAGLPFRYVIGGREVVGAMVCDAMTHSSARERGAFTTLETAATMDMGRSGMAFGLGYAIRPRSISLHAKAGWEVAFDLAVWATAFDVRSFLPVWLRMLTPLANVLAAVPRLFATATNLLRLNKCAVEAGPDVLQGPEYADFYRRWASAVPNHLVRDASFWNWRLAAPEVRWEVIAIRRRGELRAVAACRVIQVRHAKVLAIGDMLVLPDERQDAAALLHAVNRMAASRGLAAVVLMATLPEGKCLALMRNGFFPTPVRFKLIVKWLRSSPPPASFTDERAWHLSFIDSDTM